MAIVCIGQKGCLIHPNGNCPKPGPVAVDDVGTAVAAIEKEQLLDLSTEDALHGTRLQSKVLQAQLQMQQLQSVGQRAQQALETFANGMFQKHGVKQDEYVLDVDSMKFVKRESQTQG